MKTKIILLAALTVFVFTGCNKDDDSAKAKFSIEKMTVVKKSFAAGTFTFSKALIGISEIDFEIETGTEDQDYEYEGAFEFNVLTGTCSPTIKTVEIDPGTYHELEIEVDVVLASGKSIEISGTYDDGTLYQFEFTSTDVEDYDIQNTTGIKASLGETTYFTLQLELEALFNGVDFSTATVDLDDIIRISSTSNSTLASIIENNLEGVMEFDED